MKKLLLCALFLLGAIVGSSVFFFGNYYLSKRITTVKPPLAKTKSIIQKAESVTGSYITPYTISAVLPSKTREIDFTSFGISFQTPSWLVTQKELGLLNPYSSFGNQGQSFYSLDTKGDATGSFQKSGLVVSYAPRYIAATTTVDDPNYVLFDNTNKNVLHDPSVHLTILDNKQLLSRNSILTPQEVKIYTYLAADDKGNGRGTLGYMYNGDVVVHVALPNYTQSAIDINFFCYDLDSKKTLSSRCQELLTTFLSTVQIKDAIILPATPLYSQQDIFSSLSFVKRQSITDVSKVSSSDNQTGLGEPFKSIRQQPVLTTLTDADLSVMRCIPQELYFNDQGTAFASPGGDIAYDNPIHIIDPNTLHIISVVHETNGAYPSQLIICQTDDNRYLVSYTINTKSMTSDDTPNPSQDTVVFAQILSDWSLQIIASIPVIHTETKTTNCNTPLLLTADNKLYMECELPDPVSPGNHVEMRSELYMVDFAKKTYSLVKTCDNTWESKVTCY